MTTFLLFLPLLYCQSSRYNYPSFLNLYSNFLYVAVCFAYIVPASMYPAAFGHAIRPHHWHLPSYPFAIMGALDCLATSMQVFSSVYLPGPLLVLLPQASIPLSMVLSRHLLNERYHWTQYVGAAVVVAGIVVVLEPLFSRRHSPDFYCEALDLERDCVLCQTEVTEGDCLSHQVENVAGGSDSFHDVLSGKYLPWSSFNGSDSSIWHDGNSTDARPNFPPYIPACEWVSFDDATRRNDEFLVLFWSIVAVASTLPMTLSTIYKQVALGEGVELDPVFLNGRSGVYQLLASTVVLVPAAWLASPSVGPVALPGNLWDGLVCYWSGEGSVESGCHPDVGERCSTAALWVHLCLLSHVVFMTCMMLVVKYGSTALLFLALTVIVPIGNLSFASGLIPEEGARTPLHVSDLVGLALIMVGLVLFRFASRFLWNLPWGRGGAGYEDANEMMVTVVSADQHERRGEAIPPPEAFQRTSTLWSELQRSLREPLLSGDV